MLKVLLLVFGCPSLPVLPCGIDGLLLAPPPLSSVILFSAIPVPFPLGGLGVPLGCISEAGVLFGMPVEVSGVPVGASEGSETIYPGSFWSFPSVEFSTLL